ncbi:hypothetical protein ACQZ6A_06765 [Agrobacterium vitis]
MTQAEIDNLNKVAETIGLVELVRIAIGEMCYDKDPEVFRERMQKFEVAVKNSINSRVLFSELPPEAEKYVKDTSSTFAARIVSSIRHPEDR